MSCGNYVFILCGGKGGVWQLLISQAAHEALWRYVLVCYFRLVDLRRSMWGWEAYVCVFCKGWVCICLNRSMEVLLVLTCRSLRGVFHMLIVISNQSCTGGSTMWRNFCNWKEQLLCLFFVTHCWPKGISQYVDVQLLLFTICCISSKS